MPSGIVRVSVTAVDGRNRRSTTVVEPVLGSAPGDPAARTLADARSGARAHRPRARTALWRHDRGLRPGSAHRPRRSLERARPLPGRLDAEACDRGHGHAVARRQAGRETRLAGLLGRCSSHSDNAAANELEVWLAGSTSAGSDRVNATMRALGLTDSLMYGGYETRRPAAARRRSRSASRASRASGSASTRPRGISPGSRVRSTSRRPERGRCSPSA